MFHLICSLFKSCSIHTRGLFLVMWCMDIDLCEKVCMLEAEVDEIAHMLVSIA